MYQCQSKIFPNSLIEINPTPSLINVQGNIFTPGIISSEKSISVKKGN